MVISPAGWRRDHPRCKFCKYIEYVVPEINLAPYCKCKVKDKIINEELPRPFCQCYDVDYGKLTFYK